MKKLRSFTPEFKAKLALMLINKEKDVDEISRMYNIHPNQIINWRTQFINDAYKVFLRKDTTEIDNLNNKIDKLHKHIWEITVERDFLKKKFELWP